MSVRSKDQADRSPVSVLTVCDGISWAVTDILRRRREIFASLVSKSEFRRIESLNEFVGKAETPIGSFHSFFCDLENKDPEVG